MTISTTDARALSQRAQQDTGSLAVGRLLRGLVDTTVIPAQRQAHITDASVAHALADSFDDEEAEAALDALGGKINAILAVLEAHNLVASS